MGVLTPIRGRNQVDGLGYRAGKVSASGGSNLLTSLVAFWELEEASGTRVDAHSTHDFTDPASAASAAGIVGNGVDLESASSQYLLIASTDTAFAGSDRDFTIAAWVKLETVNADQRIIARWTDVSGKNWLLGINSSNFPAFEVSADGTNGVGVTHGSSLSVSTWYFVIGQHDSVNNQINVWLNNVAGTPVSHSTGVSSGAMDTLMGVDGDGYGDMDGVVDQAAFWDRILTADEKTWLYNSGSGRAYSALG